MRPKKAQAKAETICLTNQKVSQRHVIKVNGYPALVTKGCFEALRILIAKRLDASDGWVGKNHIIPLKHPRAMSEYIRRWDRDLSMFDMRLSGVGLFESDGKGRWRLTVQKTGIQAEISVDAEAVKG